MRLPLRRQPSQPGHISPSLQPLYTLHSTPSPFTLHPPPNKGPRRACPAAPAQHPSLAPADICCTKDPTSRRSLTQPISRWRQIDEVNVFPGPSDYGPDAPTSRPDEPMEPCCKGLSLSLSLPRTHTHTHTHTLTHIPPPLTHTRDLSHVQLCPTYFGSPKFHM